MKETEQHSNENRTTAKIIRLSAHRVPDPVLSTNTTSFIYHQLLTHLDEMLNEHFMKS
jgi:hypothetical protein